MKQKTNRVRKHLAIVLITFLVALLSVTTYFYYKGYISPVRNLQAIIDASDWVQHRYPNLGYSFTSPHSWTTNEIVLSKDNFSVFKSEYKVYTNALPQAYIDISFYKAPKKELADSLLDGSDSRTKADSQTRTINGVDYRVIHYPPRLERGFNAGNYLLAKDYSLLIEARLGYPSERTDMEIKKEEEIVNKIFNSVKKI